MQVVGEAMMNSLCLVGRHKWRIEDSRGEQPYVVCVRCGHYRNDAKWRDITAAADIRPGTGLGAGDGGFAGGDGGGFGGGGDGAS